MKQLARIILITLFSCSFLVYAGGKYAKVKPVVEDMAVALEAFFVDLGKAETANEVVKALDNYTKAANEFGPKIKQIMKEFPELKDEKTHPEELKPLLKKMDDLAKKLMGLYGKLGNYSKDPKVKEAMQRWEAAMATMEDKEEEKEEDQQ